MRGAGAERLLVNSPGLSPESRQPGAARASSSRWLRIREHGDPSPPNVYSLTAEDARDSAGLGVNSRVPRGVETPRACVV